MNQSSKPILVELPAGWHKKLKQIALKEDRTLREIVEHALRPIVKSGKSGMNGNGKSGQ